MLQAEYIAGPRGRLLCTIHSPVRIGGPAVLVVPAFGDEMNKTRATIARIGASLVDAGFATIVPDLSGTGDSEGEFRDATWDIWCVDLPTVRDAFRERGYEVRGLVCVRTGVLLAADALAADPSWRIACSVWLQPVLSGRQFVTQFLRIRTVGRAMNDGVSETEGELRQRLADGHVLHVGGYEVADGLLGALDRRDIAKSDALGFGDTLSIETTRLASKIGRSQETVGRFPYSRLVLSGDPYWSSTETVVNDFVVQSAAEHLISRLRG